MALEIGVVIRNLSDERVCCIGQAKPEQQRHLISATVVQDEK